MDIQTFISVYNAWDQKPQSDYLAIELENMVQEIAKELDVDGSLLRDLISDKRRDAESTASAIREVLTELGAG